MRGGAGEGGQGNMWEALFFEKPLCACDVLTKQH